MITILLPPKLQKNWVQKVVEVHIYSFALVTKNIPFLFHSNIPHLMLPCLLELDTVSDVIVMLYMYNWNRCLHTSCHLSLDLVCFAETLGTEPVLYTCERTISTHANYDSTSQLLSVNLDKKNDWCCWD